jgi:hypothetical protein
MKELEKKLRIMLRTTERSHQKLRKINEQLRSFYTRLEDISVQHKRRLPITDISFEADFRKTIEALRILSDKNYSFWQEVRSNYHSKYKKLISEDQRFLIKQISLCALSFTRQTDELFTVYKNLQNLGKDLPLRLNWWLFENATQELLNTTNRILFLVRSMEKFYA